MKYQSAHTGRPKEFPEDLANALADHIMVFNVDGTTKKDLQEWLLRFEWKGEHLTINQLSPVFVGVCTAGLLPAAHALRDGKDLE